MHGSPSRLRPDPDLLPRATMGEIESVRPPGLYVVRPDNSEHPVEETLPERYDFYTNQIEQDVRCVLAARVREPGLPIPKAESVESFMVRHDGMEVIVQWMPR